MLFTGSTSTAHLVAKPVRDGARGPTLEAELAFAAEADRSPFSGAVNLRAVTATAFRARPMAIACLPARDEAQTIAGCIASLRKSLSALEHSQCAIVVVANNCTDETFRIAASTSVAAGVPVIACDAVFDDDIADVGHARRFALECGAALAAPDGILFSTDADTEVEAGWASALACTLERGAAMAFGPVLCDATIATLDPRSADIARVEQAIGATQAALWSAIVPGRPQLLGMTPGSASMAMYASTYSSVGGLPALPAGEDRALADRFIENGHVVTYARTAEVRSSTRLSGRAPGGMADTLAARRDGETTCDGAFMPTKHFAWLALGYRVLAGEGDSAHALLVAQKLDVPVSLLLPSNVPLGERWAALRRAAPSVRPMTKYEAQAELDVAMRLLKELRAETSARMNDIETPILAVSYSND